MLDDISLYWLTNTAHLLVAALLGEQRQQLQRLRHLDPGRGHGLPRRDLPRAAELGRAGYHKLIYWNEVDKGGHFAAWEEPELFARSSARRSDRCADSFRMHLNQGEPR